MPVASMIELHIGKRSYARLRLRVGRLYTAATDCVLAKITLPIARPRDVGLYCTNRWYVAAVRRVRWASTCPRTPDTGEDTLQLDPVTQPRDQAPSQAQHQAQGAWLPTWYVRKQLKGTAGCVAT